MSAPSTIDFVTPFDPTGYSKITGADLEQLCTGLAPYISTGLIVISADIASAPVVPDANTTTKWQRYLWIRQTASASVVYVWNPVAASDATYLQWQSVAAASIGVGVIVNSMIADNTIQDIKIANLSYSKLIGAPTGLPPSGAAGSDLTGSYPNPSIANGAVTGAKIAGSTITHANIAVGAIQPATDIQSNGSAKDMIRTNAGATAMEFFTPPVLFTSGVVIPVGNALKIPQVNAGATDFQMVTASAIKAGWDFTSAGNAIPGSASVISAAHGLGATPTKFDGVLVCTTAEHGYSIGDNLKISSVGDNVSYNGLFFSLAANATNIYASMSATAFTAVPRGGGGVAVLTAANWTVTLFASL